MQVSLSEINTENLIPDYRWLNHHIDTLLALRNISCLPTVAEHSRYKSQTSLLNPLPGVRVRSSSAVRV